MACVDDIMGDLRDVNFAKSMMPENRGAEIDELMLADKTLKDFTLPVCPYPNSIPKLNLEKGTTTLAMVVDGGIVLCVDSRASSGQFVGMPFFFFFFLSTFSFRL